MVRDGARTAPAAALHDTFRRCGRPPNGPRQQSGDGMLCEDDSQGAEVCARWIRGEWNNLGERLPFEGFRGNKERHPEEGRVYLSVPEWKVRKMV